MFGGPQNAKYYTGNGLKVDTVFTRPVVRTASGEKVTVMEALRQKSFKKIYIMLGINELGWAYSELFIKKYAEVIEEIKKNAPAAQIYLQSILPVTAERSQSDDIFNNANIGGYNDLIQQMAAEKRLLLPGRGTMYGRCGGNLLRQLHRRDPSEKITVNAGLIILNGIMFPITTGSELFTQAI